ncbi:MAG TPA: hypothetical protein ENG87_04275 [Candidatus Pacearchaeota archaeon]|nr:hypothetical protein BMS3Abin17_01348 [archaeon BMS3Abin17]HDK42571.1 hypothetical protein [Candidatus Pacearchaeota archaeon]HDZ60920.1 hypothetical protein [Candidatus Pacearchaeota archaeon]
MDSKDCLIGKRISLSKEQNYMLRVVDKSQGIKKNELIAITGLDLFVDKSKVEMEFNKLVKRSLIHNHPIFGPDGEIIGRSEYYESAYL